ncbi:MAG: bifunctional methionine sulfoxide reductase B/A protein [Ignavibacteria bacterium]|nr:bifunctional methionine sulfoxide reductase B/A protein [Ignavibacteria bacterium]
MNRIYILIIVLTVSFTGCLKLKSDKENTTITQKENLSDNMNYNDLTPEEKKIIIDKGTEFPFTGKYVDHHENGTYICKRCNAPLYKSADKFESGCGWPSFDDEIPGAVKKIPDKDGIRTEIVCSYCGGHLGHIFLGEGFTEKNKRHCVNSISLNFIPSDSVQYETAIFAGGCFWGIEYLLKNSKGIISTTAGYTGGYKENPTYEEVCAGYTGHAEAVQIIFDSKKVTYEELVKLFFEIHDFTQINRQDPDIGEQYRTEIFYINDEQRKTAENIISILTEKNYKVATKLTEANKFWSAEDYHQDYYANTGKKPYCHIYKKIFD